MEKMSVSPAILKQLLYNKITRDSTGLDIPFPLPLPLPHPSPMPPSGHSHKRKQMNQWEERRKTFFLQLPYVYLLEESQAQPGALEEQGCGYVTFGARSSTVAWTPTQNV